VPGRSRRSTRTSTSPSSPRAATARRRLRRPPPGPLGGHHLRRAGIPRPARPAAASARPGRPRGDGAELHARAHLPDPQHDSTARRPSRSRRPAARRAAHVTQPTRCTRRRCRHGHHRLPSFVAEEACSRTRSSGCCRAGTCSAPRSTPACRRASTCRRAPASSSTSWSRPSAARTAIPGCWRRLRDPVRPVPGPAGEAAGGA
jgi:hypothetical protein